MNTNSNISSVDLRNAILATPLTKDGRIRMGKVIQHRGAKIDEFLDYCFVDADFISQDMLAHNINVTRELSQKEDYDYFASNQDIQKMYKYAIKRRSESAQKENFEKDLLGSDERDLEHRTYSTIFLIEGPAGCGKTTYANYLLKNRFIVDTCDVETATQTSCSCFSDIYDFPKRQLNPITAIEMLLLSQIHRRVGREFEESNEDYIKRLSEICKVYYDQFNSTRIVTKDSSEFRDFFNILNSFCNDHKDYKQMTADIVVKIDSSIRFSDELIDSGNAYDDIQAIKFLLGILMRIYFCLSKIHENKYILFLDNIERYIISATGKHYVAVFDVELQKILNSFYAAADEIEDLLIKTYDEKSIIDSDIRYKTSFGVLIAVRESTLSLMRNNHAFSEYFEQHHSENVPTYVNISNWFDYFKVFQKKIDFFLGITDKQSNLYVQTFDNILHDITISKWSLRRLLLNLFNNNFRRFFENMTEIFCNYEDVIRYYNLMWDRAKNVPWPEAMRIKHLCRKMIVRIVLDYMQDVRDIPESHGFFDSLMARCDEMDPNNNAVAKASYARRILTYLDNKNNLQNQSTVPFPELIKTLLHKPIIRALNKSNVTINDNRIEDIAEVLAIASQTAKIHTHGVELVTLNVDSSQLGKSSLSEIMKKQWNIYRIGGKVDSSKFNIKITAAGSIFAMLFPCFEYFACRYMNNSVPLFMLKSESERQKLLFGVEEQDGIFYKTTNCIDATLKYETRLLALEPIKRKAPISSVAFAKPEWLFNYDGGGTGMVHPLRIICDHLGYLQDYREFLASIDDDGYDNEHYRENDGQGIIDEAINRYKLKYTQVIETYRPYLELGNVPSAPVQ